MDTKYKSDLNHTYLIIEIPDIYEPDYQIHMLEANHIPGVLAVTGKGVNSSSRYCYDISGKISIKAMYEKSTIKEKDVRLFIEQFAAVIKELQNYLLNVNRILLEPEYIYYAQERFYFCYFPPANGKMSETFHAFTEYLVARADYKDKGAVCLVSQLHKETMEENYSMEQIVEKLLVTEDEEEVFFEDEEEIFYDPVPELPLFGETRGNFSILGKKRKKERKPKWGDWDGLYMGESQE